MSGFFGCVSRNECVNEVFYGTDYHSHLGTKRAGMAFYNGEKFIRSIHSLENGYFRNKFEDELPKFAGSCSGMGVISDYESQPVTVTSHLGRFAVMSVAKVENMEQIVAGLLAEKVQFTELSGSDINPTELVSILLSRGDSFKQGIQGVLDTIEGSCSFMVLTDHGIYACRDKFGRTPIIIGKDDKGYVAVSESSSFSNLGYEYVRDLGPGEAVLINSDGVMQIIAPGNRMQMCSFLWIYYGYPSACYEGINVEASRYVNGELMAARDTDTHVDFAAGIPDSGVAHAIGYANGKRIAYKRPFVKYTPTWPRSFMPQNQLMRDLVAKMKLLPNEAFTRGANMVLMDDSIVRGTQLKDNVVKLLESGVGEIHMRIACPPLIFPCRFLNFSSSRSTFDLYTRRVIRDMEGTDKFSDEMLAEYADPDNDKHKQMVDIMGRHLNLTSLRFQRLEDAVTAIGLPKSSLCTHCFDNSSYVR